LHQRGLDHGERLTAESFAKYRKEGGIVVIHSIPKKRRAPPCLIPSS